MSIASDNADFGSKSEDGETVYHRPLFEIYKTGGHYTCPFWSSNIDSSCEAGSAYMRRGEGYLLLVIRCDMVKAFWLYREHRVRAYTHYSPEEDERDKTCATSLSGGAIILPSAVLSGR